MSSAEKSNESKLNEILGVVLLGLAALTGTAVYFDGGGVFGQMSRDFVFGLSGAFGFLVPVVLAAAGIYVIAARRSPVHASKRILFIVGLLLVMSIWHLGIAGAISLPNGSYGMFLGDSYTMGVSTHSGGGVLGALLTYWTYTYLGLEGSWIVLLVALAVCVLAVTNLSIRKLSADIGSAVKSTVAEHYSRTGDPRDHRKLAAAAVHETSRGPQTDNPFDMRVQPIEVRRRIGGRRKTPLPQPELDPPFSLSSPPRSKPRKKKIPTPSIDNVIDLSERKAARQSERTVLREETPQAAAANDSVVRKSAVRIVSPDEIPPFSMEPDAPAEEYDPEPYREVFADTDIQFDDDPMPEVREKRRIDPELVERVTGKHARVGAPAAKPVYHVETGQNRAGTAAVLAADTDGRGPVQTTPGYKLPPIDLLNVMAKRERNTSAEVQKKAALLEETLRTFNIEAHVVNILEGPSVTRYELEPAPGIKLDRIVSLSNNLAMTLAAQTIRIEAPVPGKSVVGIEVPNAERQMVSLRELLEDPKYQSVSSPLAFTLGRDITGTPVYADIAKMPHLLIAGQTGAGKSVCINSLIVSILYRASPDDVQMLMIDPKQVELSGYSDIPHLVSDVVTSPKKAPMALNWAVNEMNQRYTMMLKRHARDIDTFNDLLQAEGEKKLPRLLVIVDELAELMMAAGKEVEQALTSIAQLGRAAGVHLVLATQRPTVKVITGLIKLNVPGRIGFAVRSSIDSRTILDHTGAEKLLGKGDMLFYTTNMSAPERIQGCNVSDPEIARVVDFVKDQETFWRTRIEFEEEDRDSSDQDDAGAPEPKKDELFLEALRLAVENDGISTSFLQRRLRIGYGRAANLLDKLQMEGIISGPNGSKAREVLISREDFERLYSSGEEFGE